MMYHTTAVHRVTKYVLIQVIVAWRQTNKMAGVLLIRMVNTLPATLDFGVTEVSIRLYYRRKEATNPNKRAF